MYNKGLHFWRSATVAMATCMILITLFQLCFIRYYMCLGLCYNIKAVWHKYQSMPNISNLRHGGCQRNEKFTGILAYKYIFDVLTTILDAILQIEIRKLVKKTCLQFFKSCALQKMFPLAQHLKCEQVKLFLCFFLSWLPSWMPS